MAKKVFHFFLSIVKPPNLPTLFSCCYDQIHPYRSLGVWKNDVRYARVPHHWRVVVVVFLAVAFFCTFLPVTRVMALPPPHVIEAKNLQANLILVGRVNGTGKVLIPEESSGFKPLKGLFVLTVIHVIKGSEKVRKGDKVQVAYRLSPPAGIELKAIMSGGLKIHVAIGDLVVVYLEQWKEPRGFYKPVAAGASVVVIEHQEKKKRK